jgi:predicted PurR-regulated permease PerM
MREDEFTRNALEATIRIGVVVLLASWCFQIIHPFVVPIVWGIILAVALYPVYRRVLTLVRERAALAATLVTVAMLLIVAWPTVLLGAVIADNVQMLMERLREGSLIPQPPPSIEAWPVIGPPLAKFWSLASVNLKEALQQFAPQIRGFATWLLAAAAQTGLAILQFVAALVISGVMLAHADGAERIARDIGRKLAGDRGMSLVDLVEATMRSVVRGVLGVALIQALLAGLGLIVAGVPAAGLWTLLCLILAVLQVGVVPIMLPAVIYMFSTSDTMTAVLFLAWSIFVGVIDNILRPIFLGRGVDVPMVVIFMGAIGGLLVSGIIGLFVGAIVLALGYRLFLAWLETEKPSTSWRLEEASLQQMSRREEETRMP